MTRSARTKVFAARLCARLVISAALLVSLTGLVSIERLFAPSADLWPRWQAHDAASSTRVEHGAWARILESYVVPGPDRVN